MKLTLNQTYEYLTCILWETTHHERTVDDQLINELFRYAKMLPMQGAVYAIDTIFLSPQYPIVIKAQEQLPQVLSSTVTINRTEKTLYVAAITTILMKTLSGFIKSEIEQEKKLKQLQIFLTYSTIDQPRQELEEAQQVLTDLLINTPASSLDALHTNCIRLLDQR